MSQTALGRALRSAAAAGDDKSVVELVRDGAPLEEGDDHGSTALGLAAIYGHHRVVTVLLTAGADPDATNDEGSSILMLAAGLPDSDIVQSLLAAGADPNLVSVDGRTALHNAIWSADTTIDVVRVLLEGGADPSVTDRSYGLTPHQWATETGKLDVAQLIAETGGGPEPNR